MEETMTTATAGSDSHSSPIKPADRRVHGKRLRDTAPRDAHAAWRARPDRADPLGILRAADATRQPDLVPLRYGRMLQSPFTFYRGSAGVMAADLARTPVSGIHVQVCGDCHLMNFGGFATPERRLIFDINEAGVPDVEHVHRGELAHLAAVAAGAGGLGITALCVGKPVRAGGDHKGGDEPLY